MQLNFLSGFLLQVHCLVYKLMYVYLKKNIFKPYPPLALLNLAYETI